MYVCSKSGGWLNPPLRFEMEPSRHKVLDLIGDLSLFARFGSQGIPVAHIVAFKVLEHSLLDAFVLFCNANEFAFLNTSLKFHNISVYSSWVIVGVVI